MISRNRRGAQGFTLLEVLVSMSMFSVAALALANAFSFQLAFNNTNETRSAAIMAAQQVLDAQRIIDPTDMPSTGTGAPQTISVGNRTFRVTVQYCPDGAAYCSSATVKQLRAEVEYRNEIVYTVDTIYAQLR